MDRLHQTGCVPCKGTEPQATDREIAELLPQIPQWKIVEQDGEKRLERTFTFKDFAAALAFTDRVGALAEAQDHHPLIILQWGQVTVDWWTQAIHGLHMNDFVMAAKSDQAFASS